MRPARRVHTVRVVQELRVVVADDDPLRRNLVRAEGLARGVLIVAEASDIEGTRAAVLDEEPDALLLRSVLADRATGPLIEELSGRLAIVVIDDDVDHMRALAVLAGGAMAVLGSSSSSSDVFHAIGAAVSGGTSIEPSVATALVRQWRELRGGAVVARVSLTARERDILVAMVDGLSTKAVARRLGVAVKTVENHKIRVFDKLGARTQAHAVAVALRLGLVDRIA
jgi:DNA-binding NarL/FixJ family response regulator